jgi:hypothetical protein
VELYVVHFNTSTWNWPSIIYHEPIDGGVVSIQQIGILYLRRFETLRTLLVNMEWEEIHQWGAMDGTSITPKKGLWPIDLWRDRLYLCSKYGGSHPMCLDSWGCTYVGYVQSFY